MLKRLLSGMAAARNGRRAAAALAAGDLDRAEAYLQRLLAARPAHAAAWNDLGIVRQAHGDAAAARECFRRALGLRPDLAIAHLNLGHLCHEAFKDLPAALEHYRQALQADRTLNEAARKLAIVLYELGRVDEAMDCLDDAVARQPDDMEALEYRLFMRNAVAGHDPGSHYREHREWGALAATACRERSRRAKGARLRVGYVSADLRQHAMAPFLLPLLEGHDPQGFEVHCYANQAESDEVTRAMESAVAGWRRILGLDDEAVVDLIRADGIDVLVDLSGHTRGNRLGVFARGAAAVQITYLGYLNTTGLAAMDYRLTDGLVDPPGASDALHSERLLRLDPLSWCYRPPAGAPEPREAPAARHGRPTFGSFNHPAKLNSQVLRLWAQLLQAVPEARLVLGGLVAGSELRIVDEFRAAGIEPGRLELLPRLGRKEFLDAVGRVDVGLDPFPYCGGSTTCDMLWMGVPVVTLAGDYGFSRSCAAILSAVGLGDCVTGDATHYIAKARELAVAGETRSLRTSLRGLMMASPLMDEPAFVRRVEAAYRAAAAGAAP